MDSATMESTNYTQWIFPQATGYRSLGLDRKAAINDPGDDEVLVELHAASLNYRDLDVAKGGMGTVKPNLVPGSDGAGIVRSAGKNVTQFKAGDRVVTYMCPLITSSAFPSFQNICSGLGQAVDGTLRGLGIFHETALVHAPVNLSFERAATLTCSGLTAWNALFGLAGRQVQAGDWVVVQGTGGVSIAALQFAVAVGANVIATTSSDMKASRLRTLGARHVLNYRETPAWGSEARKLTPDSRGVDCVVDVGGNGTLPESLKAIYVNGVVAVAGLLSGRDVQPVPMLDAFVYVVIARGILLGTRKQFKDMVAFIEENAIQPVIDDRVFRLEEAKEAEEWLDSQRHFSKVVVKIR